MESETTTGYVPEVEGSTFRLGYDVKAYNAKLRKERERLGLNKKGMAAAIGISYGHYCNIERMISYPSEQLSKVIEDRLAVLSEDLFPEQIKHFDGHKGAVEKDISVEFLFLGNSEAKALPHPGRTVEEEVELTDLKEKIADVLDTLTNREKLVLEIRYGLWNGQEHTFGEVARVMHEVFGFNYVSKTRIMQIESKALRKLRHPMRSRQMKEYFIE